MKNKITAIFQREGKLRAVWYALFAAATAALSLYAVPTVLYAVLTRLFTAWDLNAETLSYVPSWAVWLYTYASTCISVASYIILILFGRLFLLKEKKNGSFRNTFAWMLLPLAATVLFLLTDSLRLKSWLPSINGQTIAGCLLCFLYCVSESVWCIGVVPTVAKRFSLKPIITFVIQLMIFVLHCALSGIHILYLINMALLFLLLYQQDIVSFAQQRFVWLLFCYVLVAPTGGNTAFELISVSEEILTGGTAGIECGLLVTILLLAANAIMYRTVWLKVLHSGKKPEPASYVSGKRNRREQDNSHL